VSDLEEDALIARLIAASIAEKPAGNPADIGDERMSLAAGNIEREGAAKAADNMDEEALSSVKDMNSTINLLKKLLAVKSNVLKMLLSPVFNTNALVREIIKNLLLPRSNSQIIAEAVPASGNQEMGSNEGNGGNQGQGRG